MSRRDFPHAAGRPARSSAASILTSLGCAAAMLALPQWAIAQDGSLMSLFRRAIDSPGGAVSFTYGPDEPWVRAMRHQLETKGPITIAAKVVRRFSQEGCARIHARFLMHEAKLTDAGKLEDVVFAVNFNTCRDGEPPMESLDLAAIQELTSPSETTPVARMPRVVPLDEPNAPARDPSRDQSRDRGRDQPAGLRAQPQPGAGANPQSSKPSTSGTPASPAASPATASAAGATGRQTP
jgi:hypothetical protein